MWGMVAGAALSVVGGLFDRKSQNAAKAQQAQAIRKQNIEIIRQANVADANLVLQNQSNYEVARQELENINIQGLKASAAVRTAIGESNLEGRSMDRVQADVDNQTLKAKGMLNENYRRDYTNILAERYSIRDSAISQAKANAEGLNSLKTSKGSQLFGLVNAGVQGAITGKEITNMLGRK